MKLKMSLYVAISLYASKERCEQTMCRAVFLGLLRVTVNFIEHIGSGHFILKYFFVIWSQRNKISAQIQEFPNLSLS
jgi:hypothetical protein